MWRAMNLLATRMAPALRMMSVLLLAWAAFGGRTAEAASPAWRWRWSNPAPHGGNVVDMAYSPALLLGVQVAERGQVYTSADLDLWLPRDTGVTNALRGAAFLGSRLVITGENGCVLYADDVDAFTNGTLQDGATTDWLESVAASAALCVAVGDNGAIYTSRDGVTWKRQTSGTTEWLRGVAYGGTSFVAVGEYGTILTSANGTNWIPRTSGTARHLNRVAFIGGRFTAVGDAGVTISSLDSGASWSPEVSGATNILEHVAGSAPARVLAGDYEVRVHNGVGWSNALAQANGPLAWTYYSALARPSFFVLSGQTGLHAEGYTSDGLSYYWLNPYPSVRNWLWDVTFMTNLYVTVGDFGTIMTSGNGVDWVLELVPPAVTNLTLLGIGGTTNLLVAAGDSGHLVVSPNIITNVVVTNQSGVVTQSFSSLGVLWHALPPPTTNDLQGVAVLSNSLYVVTGAKGTILTSPDGTNWTRRTSPTTSLLTSVTAWPGGLAATGDDGVIITSPNGITWTKRTSNTTNWLYRVRYLNGSLIAVGQNGSILTSTNGTNWTKRTSGTTKWLTDVTFIADTWFVTGYSGTVLTSTNLTAWSAPGTITKKHLFGCAVAAGQLITVGVEGAILRAQVIPDLTPVEFLAFDHVTSTNLPASQNLYLFGGKPDQRFLLERRAQFDPTNWIPGAQLEIFDGSGTLFYVETLYGTNQPSTEFYRATLLP